MINTSETRIIFNGNGVATDFPFSFKIINDTDVKVMTVDPDGTETVLDSDYYVDVTASKVVYPGYPPGEEPAESERPPILPTGWQLVVYRDIPITQEADLGDRWPFSVIEDGLDKITMILQTSRDTSDRSLKVSESTPSDVDVVVPVAPNMTLKWDAQGKKIVLTKDPAEVLTIAENLLQQTKQQANIATEQAGIATNKANAAAESAVSAATSETNAADSEDKAQAWAESEESPDGEADSKSAKTWATEAAVSAVAALASENAAATSESSAANSATAAAGSATTATNQASTATTKASEAASSAASALASKNAAETSESAAVTSENNAAESATSAANSASAAALSAQQAAQSAQEAADTAAGLGNPVIEVTESNGTVTVKKADNSTNTFQTFTLDKAYPVGSIYMSVNSANPSTFFGGTWEAFGQGRVLIGAGEGTDVNNVKKTFAGGATGGEYEHELTTAEMPAHSHTASTNSTGSHTHTGTAASAGAHTHTLQTYKNQGEGSIGGLYGGYVRGGEDRAYDVSSKGAHTHSVTIASNGAHQHAVTINSAGSGASHNNLPPYIGVYFWRRTA